MQVSAAFLGGAVLGGVITAACGWDLFPEESQREALDRAQEELARAKAQLGKSREALAKSEGEARALAAKLEAASAKAGDSAAAAARVQPAEEGLARARGEMARLEGEVVRARALAESAALRQLVRFFSRERSPEDAVFVSEFLATAASPEEKQSLVLELIKANKDVLMALPRTAPDLQAVDGTPRPSSARSEP